MAYDFNFIVECEELLGVTGGHVPCESTKSEMVQDRDVTTYEVMFGLFQQQL